jgi:hypothetical protein
MLRLRRGLLSKGDAGENESREKEFQSFHKDGRIITAGETYCGMAAALCPAPSDLALEFCNS